MLEDNLEYMDSDDDSHDMSKSRASNMMDESMRDSSLRGTGIFKQNSNYYDKDSNSDFFGKSKQSHKLSKSRKINPKNALNNDLE